LNENQTHGEWSLVFGTRTLEPTLSQKLFEVCKQGEEMMIQNLVVVSCTHLLGDCHSEMC